MKGVKADWICPVSGPPIRDGVVVIDGDTIVEVREGIPEGLPVESFPGCCLIPGFVNVHTHLELTILRGFLEGLPFYQWIRRLTTAKYEKLTNDELLLSARLGAAECLKAGVTAVGEVMDVGMGWQAMLESGLRGVAFQEVFGPEDDVAENAIQTLRDRIASYRSLETKLTRIGVSPHAPYTVSLKLFRLVAELAIEQDLRVAVHIAESKAETEFVARASGPFADYWQTRNIPVIARGISPIQLLQEVGLITPKTLAIHAALAEKSDIDLIRSGGAAVAHCPKSNGKLGHSIAPLSEFLEAGVPVGLGTDSVASNNVVDMFEEMRTAVFLQRMRLGDAEAIGAVQALRMVTLDAAKCLGLEKELGSLEKGKLADILAVDFTDIAVQPIYEPTSALVYSCSRGNIKATFLGGEKVRQEFEGLIKDVEKVATRLKESAASG